MHSIKHILYVFANNIYWTVEESRIILSSKKSRIELISSAHLIVEVDVPNKS